MKFELKNDCWLYINDAGKEGVAVSANCSGSPPIVDGILDSDKVEELVEWLREWQVK